MTVCGILLIIDRFTKLPPIVQPQTPKPRCSIDTNDWSKYAQKITINIKTTNLSLHTL